MKRFWSMVLACLILVSMVSIAACGSSAKGSGAADATSTNSDGVAVTTNKKGSGITPEDLKTGVIYNRSDKSDAYWSEAYWEGAADTNQSAADKEYDKIMQRPLVSDEKLQVAKTYSFYMQVGDMYHVTVNKDGLFYPIENNVLSKDHEVNLTYLSTNLDYNIVSLSLNEHSADGDYSGALPYNDVLAKQEKDGEKYTTKELNGWRVILTEAKYSSRTGKDVPGLDLKFYYELDDTHFLKAETGLICDQANAAIFIEKYTSAFAIEKVSDSEGVAGVEIENFQKIKLSDNITLNLENGTNFGVARNTDHTALNAVSFVPDKLTFDGTDVTAMSVGEFDKSDSDVIYGDPHTEYKDFTYKGIKITLSFYTSDFDIGGVISGTGGKTEKETRLQNIYFETDNHIYGIYALVGGNDVTTDQDYEAFVTLILDRMLEVT